MRPIAHGARVSRHGVGSGGAPNVARERAVFGASGDGRSELRSARRADARRKPAAGRAPRRDVLQLQYVDDNSLVVRQLEPERVPVRDEPARDDERADARP